jgi:hypothetical protein
VNALNLKGVDFAKVTAAAGERAAAWDAPRVMPPEWREVDRLADGGRYVNAQRRLAVIISCARELDGRDWLHLSVSHAQRVPTWGEMKITKELFLGDREAYQVMPPKARYVNIHPNVLHMFALLEATASALPDFTGGSGSI